MKFFSTHLLGHEIFSSMVLWDTFFEKLVKPFAPAPALLHTECTLLIAERHGHEKFGSSIKVNNPGNGIWRNLCKRECPYLL